MAPWNYAKETSKLAQLDKNVFEAEWIRGCYQLIGPELPAQESVKPSMTNTTWIYRVMDALTCSCNNLPDHLWCRMDTVSL